MGPSTDKPIVRLSPRRDAVKANKDAIYINSSPDVAIGRALTSKGRGQLPLTFNNLRGLPRAPQTET